MRRLLQSKSFGKSIKRLHKNQKEDLDGAIRKILEHPESGEAKLGDLVGTYVYKCKLTNQQYLIAYQFDDVSITLLTIGTHENFYRDLKR